MTRSTFPRALPLAAALTLSLLIPAAAQAASTVTLTEAAPARELLLDTGESAPEAHAVTAKVVAGHLVLEDPAGFGPVDPACTTPTPGSIDCGPISDFDQGKLQIQLGTGSDVVDTTAAPVAAIVFGGGGDDVVRTGERGDTLIGEGGTDQLSGGAGADALDARDDPGRRDDVVDCGDGSDWAATDREDSAGGSCELSTPFITSALGVAGEARVGVRLTALTPTTVGGPASFVYKWQRCVTPAGPCTDIPGATQSVYTVTGDDAGKYLVVQLMLANMVGSDHATSAATGMVVAALTAPIAPPAPPAPPKPPASAVQLTVSGAPRVFAKGRRLIVHTARRALCPAGQGPCRVEVLGVRAAGRRELPVGAATVSLAAGRSAVLRFSLRPEASIRLRVLRRLPVTIRFRLRDGAGRTSTVAVKLTLKAPGRRRAR